MMDHPKKPPYPDSLCHRCAARRYVKGRATLFVQCTALPVKYPPQPRVALLAGCDLAVRHREPPATYDVALAGCFR